MSGDNEKNQADFSLKRIQFEGFVSPDRVFWIFGNKIKNTRSKKFFWIRNLWYQCLFSECICYKKDKKGFYDKTKNRKVTRFCCWYVFFSCFFLFENWKIKISWSCFLFSKFSKDIHYLKLNLAPTRNRSDLPRFPDPVDLLLFSVSSVGQKSILKKFFYGFWLFTAPHRVRTATQYFTFPSVPWMNERTNIRWWKDLFRGGGVSLVFQDVRGW